jgi:iron complex outermembrane receptor protein
VLAALSAWPLAAAAGPRQQPGPRLDRPLEQLTLEELMRVEVTTVAGVARSRFSSPAAVYVITAEDIRRSGHRSIAEALRMAPGVFVGRTATSGWLIGPRGLTGSSLTANRSLVLVDGRVVYDPLFNGTLWDVVDVPLADVDRIEVIRGPGSTLWGANAMNGVINVITKSARDTRGTLVSAGGGTPGLGFATVRHGDATAGGGAYRVWGEGSQIGSFDLAGGGSAHDRWTTARGGFRIDAGSQPGVSWTLQGDLYHHPHTETAFRIPVAGRHLEFDQGVTDDEVEGGYLMFRAGQGGGDPTGWSFQTYYDNTDRVTNRLGIHRQTVDADFRSWTDLGERYELVWGLHLNATEDRLDNTSAFIFDPDSRSWSSANGFAQLTAHLVPDRLHVMVGTKLTHHDFVGFVVQPGVRLWWTPSDRQTLWAAVSRPVRVPSRLEEDGLIVFAFADPGLLATGTPSGTIVPFGLGGDPELDPEEMIAYELGHRLRLGEAWELDTALFYNDYTTMISVPDPVVGVFNNLGTGVTYGGDVVLSRQMTEGWRLSGSYSVLQVEIDGPVFRFEEGTTPEQLAQLRSSWQLGERLELHGALYHVDRLPQPGIDAYERLDLGLTWRPRDGLEVALWGQNLLDPEHREASAVAIPRVVYGQLSVRF